MACPGVRNLLASDRLDWVYIEKWIKHLKLRTFNLLDI
jgi:hypothetical protein